MVGDHLVKKREERRTDADFFSFTSGGGDVSINVDPAPLSPNLDILAELYDSNGSLISSSNPVDSLPASISETAPTGLSVTNATSGQIDLSWTDNDSDGYGFRIERSTNGVSWDLIATVGMNVETYSDTNVTPGSTYWYQVSAYNGSGQSDYDGPVNATTDQASLELSANGYKNKGNKMVDLTWSGTTTSDVDIYRDGAPISTISNSSTYTDTLGKGGGSYTYQVCESGTTNCSNTITVNF